MGEKILVVDDDPDIRDVLRITLEAEGYDVVEVGNGGEVFSTVKKHSPQLILLDFVMPGMSGPEVSHLLKKDILLRHIPIIMLTGKGELNDKVQGINAGVDDYLVKPFEPKELIARVRMVIRRTKSALDANPLTKLPGNLSIVHEIDTRIEHNSPFAVCYVDLDRFKALNDTYGFSRGDEVISQTAKILIQAVESAGNLDDFIGHEGGDDFVVITTPPKADALCQAVISAFDQAAPSFYNEEDRKAGFIVGRDRQGKIVKFPVITVSIGVVTTENRRIDHVAEVGEIGAELKKYAKSLQGSNYVKERRQEDA